MATTPVTLDQQKRQLQITWAAMFSAVAVYGGVCLLLLGKEAAANDRTQLLHNAFGVLGIVFGALSIWWRRHFLSADPRPAGSNDSMAFTRFQAHSVVVWALSDAVGVCGLVLAFIVRSFQEFVPFGIAAAALLVMHHPFRLPYERLRGTTR
jgi:drug/metabolite transporter (DMT)-like permease